MTDFHDAPLEQLAESANKIIADGGLVFQKWTCESCGERVTSTTPNVFCLSMAHDVTQTPTGNYAVVASMSKGGDEVLRQLLGDEL